MAKKKTVFVGFHLPETIGNRWKLFIRKQKHKNKDRVHQVTASEVAGKAIIDLMDTWEKEGK